MGTPPWQSNDDSDTGYTSRQAAGWVGLAIFAALALGGILNVIGVLDIGYASRTVSFEGVSSLSRGFSFGSTSFYLPAGRTIYIDYDVEVRRGALWLHVFRQLPPAREDSRSAYQRVTQSGSGTFEYVTRDQGLYVVIIEGSPGGDGYDLTYTAAWGVR